MIPAQPAAAIQSNAKWQQFRTGIVGGAEGGVGAAASANAYAQGKYFGPFHNSNKSGFIFAHRADFQED